MIFHPFLGAGRTTKVLAASELPGDPTLGLMAILSETQVGKVHACLDEPAAQNGDVWLVPNSVSPHFVYYVGDRVLVPITDAYQRISGSWEKADLYQWNGSEWLTGAVYIVDGAYSAVSFNSFAMYNYSAGKAEYGYYIQGTGNDAYYGAVQSSSKISLSGYSKLKCQGYIDSDPGRPLCFGIQATQMEKGDVISDYAPIVGENAIKVVHNATGSFEIELNITDYQGDYYIGVASGKPMSLIYKIWLE